MTRPSTAGSITTIGLYPFNDIPEQHCFLRACGINLLQFVESGYSMIPGILDEYYAGLRSEIESAKSDGFRVFVILLSNMAQWQGPEEKGSWVGLRTYPRDPVAMQARLNDLARAVRELPSADGFTFFGGDPGGVPKALGPSDVYDWITMAREVKKIVEREAPHAEYNINPWAVTQWDDEGMDVFGAEFWLREVSNNKAIVSADDLIGPDCGIEFCPHNYYRSLTLRIFADAGITPELHPTAADVASLAARGATRLWSWPYFLTDEVDDGYVGPDGVTFGQTQAETRYLHKIVNDMRNIGLNGVIANGSPGSCRAEALNLYAFGRFCQDPSATPLTVIDEYASYLADDATMDALAQVLQFIENYSTWQSGLPESAHLPSFESGLSSAEEALDLLDGVTLNSNPPSWLPEPPADYLDRLRKRLEIIKA